MVHYSLDLDEVDQDQIQSQTEKKPLMVGEALRCTDDFDEAARRLFTGFSVRAGDRDYQISIHTTNDCSCSCLGWTVLHTAVPE